MSQNTVGLVLGGVVPAVLLGAYAALQKASAQSGFGPGMILVVIGAAVIAGGLLVCLATKDWSFPLRALHYPVLTGAVWAAATGLIAISLARYRTPMSVLAPLFNMNTLVAVFISMAAFSEWKTVRTPRLAIAAVLVVIGGVLAATA